VSQDGGVPLVSKRWDGHTADTQIFQERAQVLRATFQTAPSPRYLGADSQLDNEDNAANLHALGLITRMPNTLKLVSQVITDALRWGTWPRVNDTTRYHRVALCHDGMAQRWLVVASAAALQRAEATVSKAQQREYEAIETHLFHLQAHRFETPAAAQAALGLLATSWTDHQGASSSLIAQKRSAGTGRPTPTTPIQAIEWQIPGGARPDDERMGHCKPGQACFVVGTHVDARPLSDADVIQADKGQAQAEGGFRFLKDPRCLVSSLFVKKPSRIQGLLMVMTRALLVYAVVQRRLRQQLVRHNETVPHQINQPTRRPTLRWVFQLLEGIHRVHVTVQGQVYDLVEGLNEGKVKVLRLFGEGVCRLYQISPG
jgi:transposase